MERILRWLEAPIHALLWLGMFAALLMVAHVSADVTSRTLFNSPIEGTTEFVSAYYMVAVAYLPWAWIARNDGHIRVEVFTSFAPARVIKWLDIFVKIITIAYISFFVWRAMLRAVEQYYAGEVWQAGTKYLAIWPSRWVLPVAGILMILYLVIRVAADLAAAVRR
jgi:TRAP-type C4-dicarboxylate transport system permease small subunit